MKKMVIMSTVPFSLATLTKGQPKYLSSYFNVSLVTSNGDLNKLIEEQEGIIVDKIDMTRKMTPFQDLKSLWKLYRYFILTKPDIVYTFTPKAGLLGMIAAFVARVRVRVHNVVGMPLMEATGKKKKLLEFVEKSTYFFSTNLFCNSHGLKEYMLNTLTKRDIKVIGEGSINGVDIDFFKDTFSLEDKDSLRKKISIEEDDFVLVFVGRIVKDKGVNELINAFILLQKKYSFLKLLMVGDFEEELSPINDESKYFMENNSAIISVGFQEDIRAYLSISDLFLLPSYREGLPNVLIEAGSFGIPLMATNINGCNEIIINGENGILVKKKSVQSLIDEISKLIDNKELYNNLKKNVRESIIHRYEQKFFLENLKNELLRLS